MQDSSLPPLTKEVFFISSSAHLPNSWLVLACTEAWMTELMQGAQLQCEVVNEKGRGRALSSPFSTPKWQISSSYTVKLCSVNTDISPMLLIFWSIVANWVGEVSLEYVDLFKGKEKQPTAKQIIQQTTSVFQSFKQKVLRHRDLSILEAWILLANLHQLI